MIDEWWNIWRTPAKRNWLVIGLLCTLYGLSVAATSEAEAAAGRQMEVDVTVDQTTVNGAPWHGMNGALLFHNIPLMPNMPTYAPSPILCIVTPDGQPDCHGRMVNGQLHSACAQSNDCEWPNVRIPEGIFAMIFLTQGSIVGNKLVDVVVVTDRRLPHDDPDRTNMDNVARSAAAQLAPTSSPWEIERRQRPFQVFRLEDCQDGCRLRQSKIVVILDR